jgi:DNA topoisomerase-1
MPVKALQIATVFHPLIQQVPSGKMAARELGVDPATGEPVFARISKNGPCVQLGNSDVEKPRFVSMPKGLSLFTITLEQALSLFQNALPLTLGEYQGADVVIGEGKYGPYIRYNGSFTSLPKNTDPYSVTMEQAIELLEQKQQQEEPIHVFGDVQVLNGRYGAYIKTPQGNYKLPRGVEVASLTAEICQDIIAKSEPTSAAKRKFKSKK